MARKNETAGFWANMTRVALYKRNQGRLTRQLTAVSIGLIVILGCWRLSSGPLGDYDTQYMLKAEFSEQMAPVMAGLVHVGIPVLVALAGGWMVYRSVNYPRFADFLISVEAEMDKVTWAGKQELIRSAIVVIATMFFLGFVLFLYDLFWRWFFQLIGFLQLGPG